MALRNNRYAAKLLFQFRVGRNGTRRRRLCEERTILLQANSPRQALRKAKAAGAAGTFVYMNSDGLRVHFEFVGVLDLLHLGRECAQGEVWYEMKEIVDPIARRSKLIPSDADLMKRAR